jgi:hypothetical protein
MPIQLNRNIFKFFILTSIIGIALLTSVYANSGKPTAVVESGSYDFGITFEGKEVLHDYIIKNTGDVVLEIQSVKSG